MAHAMQPGPRGRLTGQPRKPSVEVNDATCGNCKGRKEIVLSPEQGGATVQCPTCNGRGTVSSGPK